MQLGEATYSDICVEGSKSLADAEPVVGSAYRVVATSQYDAVCGTCDSIRHANVVTKHAALSLEEAQGMGEPEPDAEVTAAVKRLQDERLAYRFIKRAFDIVFSIAVLVLFSWLFLVVAIAIKIDDPKGPVFFGQERVGKDGKHFHMWKFRSMATDAEARLEELQAKNEKTSPVFKMKDDPRVTRIGHLIRKTSIDERPQFLNVFLGDMSVVGPRPALPNEVATYNDYQRQRLLVKPGMACYWQTRRNRDSITFDEWVDLDLWWAYAFSPSC